MTSAPTAAATASPCDPPAPGAAHAIVAAAGVVAAMAAGTPALGLASGAARLVDPSRGLAAFGALTVLVLARPGRRGVSETLALAAVAAPFHLALAAAAGGGPGFLAASALAAGAWAGAALVAVRAAPRAAALLLALPAFALPLAAYGLADFARLRAPAAFLASPLTGPVVLAHRAGVAATADAVPAVVAASAVAVAALALRRVRGASAGDLP